MSGKTENCRRQESLLRVFTPEKNRALYTKSGSDAAGFLDNYSPGSEIRHMFADTGKPGRPPKPARERAKTRTLAAYDDEWEEVKRLAKGYKTPFDFVRALIRAKHTESEKVIRAPALLKANR